MTNPSSVSEASVTAIAGGNFDRLLSYSETEWEFFSRCAAALDGIKLLEERSRTRSLAVNRVAVELGVNRSTVYHWLRKYDGDIVRLFPRSPGPSRGTVCLSLEREAAIQVGIKQEFLSDQKISVAELVRRIGELCEKRGLDPVSRHAVQQRIDRLDQHMIARKRGELLKAEDLTLRPGTHVVSWPFERWQIDHTVMDVLVLSSIDGQVLGRPYITLIIDVATRMVAGYYLSWDAPSARSVAMALVCAVGSKEHLLERLGLRGAWPICGLPLALHSDNAGEFAKSVAYRRGCDRYKIGREFRDQGKPWDGGHIERLIGMFMARCHFLPGTTFSNIRQREKYDSAAKARLTITELEAWLVEQILDYHDRRHSTLGCSPREAWEMMCREQHITPRWPDDMHQFYLHFLPLQRVTIQRQGVQFRTLEYYGPVLQELRRHGVEKVDLRYDPNDMTTAYIQDRAERWVPVPIRYPDCPPITLLEVEAELRRRRLQNEGPAKGHLVIEAIKQRRAEWEHSERLSKRDRLTRDRIAEGRTDTVLDRGQGAVSAWEQVMRGAR